MGEQASGSDKVAPVPNKPQRGSIKDFITNAKYQ